MVSSHPTVSSHGQAGENEKADGDNLVNQKMAFFNLQLKLLQSFWKWGKKLTKHR